MFRFILVPVVVLSLLVLSTSVAHANIVGAGTQNFNPITDGLDYVTVHSTKTLRPGLFNLGLFANYAVNSLPYIDNSSQNRTKFNDTLTSTDINVGVGIMDRWDFGLSIPAIVAQTADNVGIYGSFVKNGRTETRVNTKYRVHGDEDGGVALIGTINFLATEDDPFSGVNAGPIYNLEVAIDREFSNVLTGAFNFGHRWRSPGTTVANAPIEPMRNQFIASIGTSYFLENLDTKLIGEIFGAFPSQSVSSNPSRNLTSLELLVGAKHDFLQSLAGHIGAGAELIQGVSSPDWRIYAGLNFNFGPLWSKRKEEQVVSVSSAEPKPERINIKAAEPEIFQIGTILFDTDSDKLKGNYRELLAPLVVNLRDVGFTRLSIDGHTDSMGGLAHNMDLSQRRANAIKDYLVSEVKLASDKLTATGFGPTKPIASNGNFQGRQTNRRVEFKIER